MKTVSGEVVSTKTVSLSRASKILSNFVSVDNGASPAYNAYLKRASASFDELAQLHKEYKSSSGRKHNVKRQQSDGVVTQGTVESVKYDRRNEHQGVNKSKGEDGRVEVSVSVDEEIRRRKSKNKRDDDEERRDEGRSAVSSMEVKRVDDGNVGDVEGAGKKSKKKREQRYGDHDAVDVTKLKNGPESVDGSTETKKKKRDKQEQEKRYVAADIEKDSNGQAIENGNSYSDKQKKYKKDQHYGELAAANVVEVKNEIESLDGSKERKKMKKKKKRDDYEKDDPEIKENGMHILPGSQNGINGEASQIVEEDGDEQKKHKKKKKNIEIKEERVSSGIKADEQRDYVSKGDQGNIEDEGGQEKKHKKKRSREGKERENEAKLEIEVANNKESKKRKHESIAAEGLNGSQEEHKSKKKRR